MLSCDSIVRSGRVVLPEASEPIRADLAIADGRVAGLLAPGATVSADRVWDVGGDLVLPGAVDPHVHVSWPYLDSRTQDDYATATRAAALGGTTTIIDFAIEGRESPAEALARRRAQAEGKAVVDFSFHVVVSDDTPAVLDEMSDVVAQGVTSFKLYMTYRRRGLAVSDKVLAAVARRAAELGAVVGVHAEDADLDDAGTNAMRERGNGAARYLALAKPPEVEVAAIRRAARAASDAGARLWILHLSSRAGLEAAIEARSRIGQPAALETCPQYLFLGEEHLRRPDGHRFLCSPPLRGAGDRQGLWEGLETEAIDWIGTDHCLFLSSQKDDRADAFWDCPHGLPGVQTRPMLVLDAARRRGVSFPQIVRMLATNAARWFGLYPRKGTLLPGSDADLAVWPRVGRAAVRTERLAMGGDWTPYEGHDAWEPPRLVLVRGEPVVSTEGPAVPDGHGRFLERLAG
jgi:dihydropyrimidinase